MFRTLILSFVIVTTALVLSACTNTVRGVGQDFEKAGQEIQKSTR